ncbi:ATP-dependent DNA helicase [Thiohalocapsa marina]|uniref:DNA 5'-3' helicase n=1 Tax=Thiohalocapsa marina TaxID=424902 RepID=A0A5M8FJ04_9GAMM|nr:ATP-dependent DNA helicase [Thiohalocapsa marina]KAA6184689.1 ATP-dependent DNA helicase [Thiohalocapsa marina]
MTQTSAGVVDDILGEHGVLAGRVQGFVRRPQQQAMAEVVFDAIDSGELLICEAGTGTGKTFAYLVPALASGRKVLVSTGTRNLQDQLFHRDIPLIRSALSQPIRIALLKGRGNYLCRYRLDLALARPDKLSPQARQQLGAVHAWAADTRDGDIAELALPEAAPVWPAVTSTTDNCLGQECPSLHKCHLLDARRRAQEADLVVINHHLLCADMALRDEGFGEVLPGTDCVIVDEAHQLPEVAAAFFGATVSSRQLLELVRDTSEEAARDAGDVPEIPLVLERLRHAIGQLREALGGPDRRAPWQDVERSPDIQAALEDLGTVVAGLAQVLEAIAERAKGLDRCLLRAKALATRLAVFDDADDETRVRWLEVRGQGFRLNQTPLDVAELFRGYRERHPCAWVFTSATLAVAGSFEHFARQIGAEEPRTALWDSPFDYPHQALLFAPTGLPDPADPGYSGAVADLALDIIDASRGRAFLLFTSHRALREVATRLQHRIPYPLLVQGTAPRAELVERFRTTGNAVLLGTSSFWEGVDVRGEALSCVVIDRLPFASPGDPILQARLDALRRGGGSPFRDHQLPQAVIALKQGAGRLIRDAADRGVLVVCDPRLYSRGYGKVFLDSLPPMARSRALDDVRAFFGAAPDDDDR